MEIDLGKKGSLRHREILKFPVHKIVVLPCCVCEWSYSVH